MQTEKWNEGIPEELKFWESWFETYGYIWPDDYKFRIDPETELQADIAELLNQTLPDSQMHLLSILDMGAGPLTFLGKKFHGKDLNLMPVDALADQYDEMLARHGIVPPIRTDKWKSEDIADLPGEFGKFNMIVAQNTLDHSIDPLKAILGMRSKLLPGGIIYLKHFINEGERGGYGGLHQWNFYMEGECMMLRSQEEFHNVTKEFAQVHGECDFEYRLTDTNEIIYIIKPK
jgi:SAM-dependent methyltransferase